MGTSSANTHHSGGYLAPGVDCEICHTHKDPQGGWGASASCDDCHKSAGFPNLTGIARTHGDANESLTYHDLHANSALISDCNECHVHDGKTVSPNTGTHADGTVNFGGTRLTTALNYGGSGYATVNCTSANGCHDADNNEWRLGLDGTVVDACADCHDAGTTNVVDAGKTLDQGGYPAPLKSSSTKHSLHINNTFYVSGSCSDCHGTSANTGAHAGHVNGTADTAATAKLTSYTKATFTCVTSCHLANTTNDWTNAAALACADCHAGTYIGGGANMPATGLHTGVPTVTGITHDDSFLYNGGGSTAVCTTCHTGAISAAHVRPGRSTPRACSSTPTSASPTARRRPARRAWPAATATSSPASAPGAASGASTRTPRTAASAPAVTAGRRWSPPRRSGPRGAPTPARCSVRTSAASAVPAH